MRTYSLLGFLVVSLSMFGLPADAQTPDGETPANEGVCDGLIGLTPGLYGLCVAFCEAQDCEATFDPATGEIRFDASCKPSSPRLLRNYNKKMQPGDPPMPCVNAAQDECLCWTEDELDTIADGRTLVCDSTNGIIGFDVEFPTRLESAVARLNSSGSPGFCVYLNPPIVRSLSTSLVELMTCQDSITAECANRGFGGSGTE